MSFARVGLFLRPRLVQTLSLSQKRTARSSPLRKGYPSPVLTNSWLPSMDLGKPWHSAARTAETSENENLELSSTRGILRFSRQMAQSHVCPEHEIPLWRLSKSPSSGPD